MRTVRGCMQEFVRESSRRIVIEARTPAELLDKMAAYTPPESLIEAIKKGKVDKRMRG